MGAECVVMCVLMHIVAKSMLSALIMQREPNMAAVLSNFILLPISEVTTFVHIFHVSLFCYLSISGTVSHSTTNTSIYNLRYF